MALNLYFSEEKNEALLSQLPASSPTCRLGLFPLLAITVKGLHFPTSSRTQRVPLKYTCNVIQVLSGACFLHPAGGSAWKRMIKFRRRKTSTEEEESCEEESDLTADFESEMDELASVVEELEDTLDIHDVEDLRELSEGRTRHHQRNTRKGEREKEESRLPAFLVSLFSRSFWFATCLFERHLSRERKDKDLNKGLSIRRSS